MVWKKLFGDKDIKPLHFGRKVGAATDGTETYDIKKDGTIEELEFRIYSGAQDTLRLNGYIEHDETDTKTQIVETPDDQQFIGGNEDFFTFRTSEKVTSEDKVVIEYENTDTQNPHRYKINMEIDRTGGTLSNLLR